MRWDTAGKLCAGDGITESVLNSSSIMFREGKFLKMLTLSWWGITGGIIALGCLCGCVGVCVKMAKG